MLAHVCDMEASELIYTAGDCHLYSDQLELAKEQVKREPLPLPKIWLNPDVKDLFNFTVNDIRIDEYNCHEPINYPVSV